MSEILLKYGCRGNKVKLLQNYLHILDDGIFGKLTEEAVKDFQRKNGLKVDGIVGDETWKKLTNSTFSKSSRQINEIIVHCTATKEGKHYNVNDITRWHKQRGYTTIGYHYLVYLDGSIHTGRNINIAGAHCLGHNTNSIGVCYVGGLDAMGRPKDTRTDAQKEGLLKLLKELKRDYPMAKIRSHRDFANKACPSFDATAEYRMI